MKTFLRWIWSVLGYGAYTLAVLVVLLWLLFPAESVRAWLERDLNSRSESLAWKIGELRTAWPLSIVASDIRAAREENRAPLIRISEIKLRPDVAGFRNIREEWPVAYSINMMGGRINGQASLEKEKGTLKGTGKISRVRIGEMEGVWEELGRQGSGLLSGSFTISGKWPVSLSDDIEADLMLANGSLQLLQPVFALDALEFNSMTTSLTLKDRVATLEKGQVDSDLFGAAFSGSVTLADNLLGSGLDIQGSFEPRPELLAGLKDAAVMQLIKGQLRENTLSFTITDTLLEPGLLFQGASGVIDGLIQGGGR